MRALARPVGQCTHVCIRLGLPRSRAHSGLSGCLQAVVVAALEEHLYAGEHQHGAEDAYPAAFVVLTSLLGAAMTWKLSRPTDRLGPVARWVQLSVYSSKLSMLLVPQVGQGDVTQVPGTRGRAGPRQCSEDAVALSGLEGGCCTCWVRVRGPRQAQHPSAVPRTLT